MDIQTNYDFPPIPVRDMDWSAIDADSFDGVADGNTMTGRGATKEAAINDLLSQIYDDCHNDNEFFESLEYAGISEITWCDSLNSEYANWQYFNLK